jgi:coenzyme PQQ precursor peptide PqqA
LLQCATAAHENHEPRLRDFSMDHARRAGHNGDVLCFTADTSLSPGATTMWTKPEFTEMRFGFEVTMYIYNR